MYIVCSFHTCVCIVLYLFFLFARALITVFALPTVPEIQVNTHFKNQNQISDSPYSLIEMD